MVVGLRGVRSTFGALEDGCRSVTRFFFLPPALPFAQDPGAESSSHLRLRGIIAQHLVARALPTPAGRRRRGYLLLPSPRFTFEKLSCDGGLPPGQFYEVLFRLNLRYMKFFPQFDWDRWQQFCWSNGLVGTYTRFSFLFFSLSFLYRFCIFVIFVVQGICTGTSPSSVHLLIFPRPF